MNRFFLALFAALAMAGYAQAFSYTPNSPTGPTPVSVAGYFIVTYNGVTEPDCNVTLTGNITTNGKYLKLNHATVTSGGCVIPSTNLPITVTPTGANPGIGSADVTVWYNGTPCTGTPNVYTEDKGSMPGLVLFTQFGSATTCWAAFKGTSTPIVGVAP